MKLLKEKAEVFVASGIDEAAALSRTTDLCIGAHQDDIEIMAFSPIAACYGKNDKWFSGVVVSDGAGSPRTGIYESYTNEQMMDVRVVEQKNAASVGDYSTQIFLGYKSSEIKDPNSDCVVNDIKQILLDTQPENVYTHNLADKHDTHVAVVLRVIKAIRQLPKEQRPKKLYAMEVWRGLDWLVDSEKTTFDTSQRPSLAAALLGVYDSQIAGGKRYDLATVGRRLANATFFESHGVDECESLTFGLDMSELIVDDTISPVEFIKKHINSFLTEVDTRVGRF